MLHGLWTTEFRPRAMVSKNGPHQDSSDRRPHRRHRDAAPDLLVADTPTDARPTHSPPRHHTHQHRVNTHTAQPHNNIVSTHTQRHTQQHRVNTHTTPHTTTSCQHTHNATHNNIMSTHTHSTTTRPHGGRGAAWTEAGAQGEGRGRAGQDRQEEEGRQTLIGRQQGQASDIGGGNGHQVSMSARKTGESAPTTLAYTNGSRMV